jgi:hypothetical protein
MTAPASPTALSLAFLLLLLLRLLHLALLPPTPQLPPLPPLKPSVRLLLSCAPQQDVKATTLLVPVMRLLMLVVLVLFVLARQHWKQCQ